MFHERWVYASFTNYEAKNKHIIVFNVCAVQNQLDGESMLKQVSC